MVCRAGVVVSLGKECIMVKIISRYLNGEDWGGAAWFEKGGLVPGMLRTDILGKLKNTVFCHFTLLSVVLVTGKKASTS